MEHNDENIKDTGKIIAGEEIPSIPMEEPVFNLDKHVIKSKATYADNNIKATAVKIKKMFNLVILKTFKILSINFIDSTSIYNI